MTTIEELRDKVRLAERNFSCRLPVHIMQLMTQAASELEALQKEVAELEADNAALHDKCICAFCKQEFSKADLSQVAEHLIGCEKSPLVKRGKELFEENNTLRVQNQKLMGALREISSAPASGVSWLEQCERRMKIAEQALATQPQKP